MKSVVLVGLSVREVTEREALVAAATARGGDVAFLQQGEPTLAAVLTRLADAGADEVTLVGIRLGPIGPAVSWLRRIASHWWRERPGNPLTLRVATTLARDVADIEAAAATTKPIDGDEPGLTCVAWESVPRHRHQVLICRGPRCAAKGSEATQQALTTALAKHQLGDNDVLITQTGCLFPCNHAPVVAVQPDDVWYGQVDQQVAATIVVEHFVHGRPVAGHRLPRVSDSVAGGTFAAGADPAAAVAPLV